METAKPVDHPTSPTLGSGAWRGRSGSRPCETTACSAAAGCRVDRLRPDKPGRLHRSRPQARAAGQAAIGRGVSPRSGEVSVSLDVTEHADLERDSRGARVAHPPGW
jgi:hypothetical protein